jgi:hypothetical protein
MLTHFIVQLLSHTPLYVWAILAFLVYRGTVAMRDREVAFRKLCIIPLVMLGLSLQDMSAKFGLGGLALAAWTGAALATLLLVLRQGGVRIAAGKAPGSVRVPGSRLPLAMMMAVFFTKYTASVVLAIQPHARQDALFVALVCALFGVFNGWFLGRLAGDVRAWLALQGSVAPARPV